MKFREQSNTCMIYCVPLSNLGLSPLLTFSSDSRLPPPFTLCMSFSSLSFLSKDENGIVLSLGAESQRLIVSARPFRLDIMEGPEVLLSLNSRGLLAFEHLRLRKDT